MIGWLTHQLREAGLDAEARELSAALRRGRRGAAVDVSPGTREAVVRALRRCGEFAPELGDFRTCGLKAACR